MPIDPVECINISDDIRYAWFDHVFKGAAKPSLLKAKVNYQVTGANLWKHAPSVAAMSRSELRLFLSAERKGETYGLSEQAHGGAMELKVDLADADRKETGGDILGKQIDTHDGLEFVSEPLAKATEMSGLFSGRLAFTTNKKDFDFEIDLYELTTEGVMCSWRLTGCALATWAI